MMTASNMIRSLLFVAMAGTILITMSACNTVAGAGKDTQKAGEKIEDTANAHNNNP